MLEELNQEELRSFVSDLIDKRRRLIDKSWNDIRDEFDLDCSDDTIRKISAGVELAQSAGMHFDYELDETQREFIERQKLQDARRELNKDMREISRTELICERLRDAIKSLPEIIFCFEPPYKKSVKKDLIVGLGDFHYGTKFNTYGLHGEILNHYDSQVFNKRMTELASNIIEVCKKESPDQITMMLTGDLLDGLIRASQLQKMEFNMVESTMKLSETMVSWLVALEDAVRLPIRVYGVRGNHGEIRPLGSKAGQFPAENLERIIMHHLYWRFEKSKYIHIERDDAPMMHTIDVCGYQVVLTHGTYEKLESLTKDYVNLYHEPISMIVVGHIHTTQTFTSGTYGHTNVHVEVIPSICGSDPYAQSKGYSSKAGATLILMEEGYGRRCIYPIILR